MSKKNIVKTLQGKPLNMDELVLRNEKTQPVGNLAKGKNRKENQLNETVATNTRRPSKGGRRQIENLVQDAPVMNSIKAAKNIARKYIESQYVETEQKQPVVEVSQPVVQPKPAAPMPKPVAKTLPPTPPVVKPQPEIASPQPVVPTPVDEVSNELLEKVIDEVSKPKGLAAAIAKAREVKQEPLKTPREEARGVDGVKKI
jgi:hypothetical protein